MTDAELPAGEFQGAYEGEPPPWDIGRPQPALVALADTVRGSVLDVGCGTGEHALFYADRGHEALGLDGATKAIAQARAKAKARNLPVTFVVGDALQLGRLGRRFDVAIDSGVFHVFGDPERARYVQSLAEVLGPGGVLHLLCFSELTPPGFGPRRVTQAEIRLAFSDRWVVRSIDQAKLEVNRSDRLPIAWRAVIERTE